MKKVIFIIAFSILNFSISVVNAQVGINNDNSDPDASSMLDIKSTDKGLLVPRMTTAQRTIIASPANGLLVFDNTTNSFWFYKNNAWEELTGGGTSKEITDADNDTKIQVEASADEDIIRMTVAGTEFVKMDGKTMHISAPGESLFIGKDAGINEDEQFRRNIFIGHESGKISTTGEGNVGLGNSSLYQNTTGNFNTGLGRESMLLNATGNDNTATGYVSLRHNVSGNQNSAFGSQALILNQTGSDNTAIGMKSLFNNMTGSSNTAIGYNANVSANNLKNTTAIGANALVSQDSSLILGNAAKVGIGTAAPDAKLHVVGKVKIVDGNQSLGKILVSDANGLGSWADPIELAVPNPAQPVPIRYQGNIIYVHPSDNATDTDWTTAQTTCSNLTAFGFSDWYLPEKMELDAMHKQSYLITGLSQLAIIKYWSNTEQDASNAFTQRLDYGGPDPDDKTDTTGHSCRCVRKN